VTGNIVRRRVAENNQWYVDDQRAAQLGTPGARWALELRWRLFERAIDAWIERGVRAHAPLRVLDAGCGDGINMSVLEGIFAGRGLEAYIVGSDYNSLRLSRARDGGCRSVVEADLLRAPFASGSFDVVLCSHVLEHIREDVEAMRELARMVAPDGLVIVAVPNEGCAAARLRNHVIQRSILRTTDHVQFYTADVLLARLAEAGLRPIAPVGTEGFFMSHLGVSTRLRELALGRSLIALLASMFSGQAAGLVVALERQNTRKI
jgi:2-polyprenyl-3-methyl-5-hydroxy-6-metoxy-1,4-benzoquinol methylase